MNWIKLHNDALLHKRVRRLSHDAKVTWIYAICYSNSNLTDGILDQLDVDTICDLMRVDQNQVIDELIAVELLYKTESVGYEIRDYLDYQTSKSQIDQKRMMDRRRKQSPIRSGTESETHRNASGSTSGRKRIRSLESESEIDVDIESEPQSIVRCNVDLNGQPIEFTKRHFVESTLAEADRDPQRSHWREWLKTESIRRRVRHFDPWAYAILNSWISGSHESPAPPVDIDSWNRASDIVNEVLRKKRQDDQKAKSLRGYIGQNGEWISLK